MLQEAVRTSSGSPLTPEASGAARIAPHAPCTSRRHRGDQPRAGPFLIYVPSMRNGASPDDPAEDRGNAILSTLPLSEPGCRRVARRAPTARRHRRETGAGVRRRRASRRAWRRQAVARLLDALDAGCAGPIRRWPVLPGGPLVIGGRFEHVARTGRVRGAISQSTVSRDAALARCVGPRTSRSRLHVLSRRPRQRARYAGRPSTDPTIASSWGGSVIFRLGTLLDLPVCHSFEFQCESDLLKQMPVLAQPAPRILIVGARMCDEPPEMPRMIEPPQMHQLVNQHVLAHGVRHQHETPVQADVTRSVSTSPSANAGFVR